MSLEAQSVEVPVITTRATGAIDTIEDNHTGFLVNVGESVGLADKVEYLINHPSLKEEMGKMEDVEWKRNLEMKLFGNI